MNTRPASCSKHRLRSPMIVNSTSLADALAVALIVLSSQPRCSLSSVQNPTANLLTSLLYPRLNRNTSQPHLHPSIPPSSPRHAFHLRPSPPSINPSCTDPSATEHNRNLHPRSPDYDHHRKLRQPRRTSPVSCSRPHLLLLHRRVRLVLSLRQYLRMGRRIRGLLSPRRKLYACPTLPLPKPVDRSQTNTSYAQALPTAVTAEANGSLRLATGNRRRRRGRRGILGRRRRSRSRHSSILQLRRKW